MTTESGSDSEAKPEQEAEPQEAVGPGPQGPAGAQPGPEEQRQALEQFAAAAAEHSTPVRKEVSPPHLGPVLPYFLAAGSIT